MDFSAILNYTKKAAKSLTVGVVGAVTSDKTTGVVPAIAPIPIEAVDTSYAQPEVIKQDPNEPEKDYEEVVVEASYNDFVKRAQDASDRVKKAKLAQKDANAKSAYKDRVTKGVRFYDKKGKGHIRDGKKVYS